MRRCSGGERDEIKGSASNLVPVKNTGPRKYREINSCRGGTERAAGSNCRAAIQHRAPSKKRAYAPEAFITSGDWVNEKSPPTNRESGKPGPATKGCHGSEIELKRGKIYDEERTPTGF